MVQYCIFHMVVERIKLMYIKPFSTVLARELGLNQFSSVSQSCPTFCDPMNWSMPGLPVHHQPRSLQKPVSIESILPPNHLILCCPLLLLPSIFPNIRVFSNESALRIRWPKYWSFSFSISPSNEHPVLIFRMDWLDLLAVKGTFKSLLQHHSSNASILQRSAFFMVQLSQLKWCYLSIYFGVFLKS